MKLLKRILKWSAAVILLVLIGWLFIAYWTSTNDCARNAAAPTSPMKAILNCEYGVENLQLRDIEKPTPADNEVLVRVRAASVNPVDGHTIRGGWLMRPMSGMRKPKNTRFGTDFAGVVEAVGKNVSDFQIRRRSLRRKKRGRGGLRLRQGRACDCFQTEQRHIRTSGFGRRCRADGIARSARQRAHSVRTKGLDQRRIRRSWHFRGSNRESVRRRRHGCLQHAKYRSCEINRRRSRDRLHQRRFYQDRSALRHDLRFGRQPFILGASADLNTQRHLCPRRNWRSRSSSGNVRPNRPEFLGRFPVKLFQSEVSSFTSRS